MISSYANTPRDQKSTEVSIGEFILLFESLSGGMYSGVPQIEVSTVPTGITSPKSQILTAPLWSTRTLEGFKSRYTCPRL